MSAEVYTCYIIMWMRITVQRGEIQLSKCHEIKERGNFSRNFFLSHLFDAPLDIKRKKTISPSRKRLDSSNSTQQTSKTSKVLFPKDINFEVDLNISQPARICWKNMKYECSLSFFGGRKLCHGKTDRMES